MFREERRLLLGLVSLAIETPYFMAQRLPTTLLDELDTGEIPQEQFTKRIQQL